MTRRPSPTASATFHPSDLGNAVRHESHTKFHENATLFVAASQKAKHRTPHKLTRLRKFETTENAEKHKGLGRKTVSANLCVPCGSRRTAHAFHPARNGVVPFVRQTRQRTVLRFRVFSCDFRVPLTAEIRRMIRQFAHFHISIFPHYSPPFVNSSIRPFPYFHTLTLLSCVAPKAPVIPADLRRGSR